LTFLDVDGHRITAFITDGPARGGARPVGRFGPAAPPARLGGGSDPAGEGHRDAELPRIRYAANKAWLEIVMTAMDLVAWSKLLGFADQPDLARCEIATFRYRVLHVAARIGHGPGKPDSAPTTPGGGPNRSPKPGSRSAPRSPEHKQPLSQRPET
jgi:hypothetical protein